ncbi:ECF transporter S component [Sporomusa sp.]|uniref:ECF transporter S component n=1 Tax=Sporomusa sp. TaxID=2078658 RepID=UPI002CB9E515|nr:ECF transporter S component [Sporomusa sp.]HWR45755.1 ECF transporter S component [Sporomusa sp.]
MNLQSNVLAALFIALSFIGANVKVLGSIAFDSLPGFLGTLVLGPAYGAVIGAAGHFLTAVLSGFPLSLPVHLITMCIMAATMAIFGIIYRRLADGIQFSVKGALLSGGAAVLINGPIGLLVLSPLLVPIIGQTGIIYFVPILSGVAALNVLVAFVIYRLLGKAVLEYKG